VAQENQTGPVHERDWGSGPVSVIDRYSTLESLGWQAVAEVKRETIIQPFAVALLRSSLITFLAVLLVIGVLMFTFHRMLVRPIVRLTNTAQQIAAGSLDLEAPTEIVKDRQDEIGRLTQAVATMTEQLRLSIQNLERRVQERTRDLEMTATIGREASALQSIDRLLNDTVNMIVENFPQIYHAQIFLVDNVGEYANLVASTGDAGRELLRRGHRLSVGSVSVIGRVTQLGQTVIARDTDTSTSSIHRRNEFLPETRAELALPLVRGEQILGALDMQSKYADAFSPEEQRVAEALATQVAIAINNARLYEEIRERADEVEKLNRLLTRTSWEDMLTATRRRGRVEAVAGPAAADIETTGWNRWQLEARGEVLGVVDWQVSANQVSDNSRQMAEELVGRLAITLETVRLLERSERLAERERLVNQISGRLQAEPNVALILETAVQELAAILQTPDVSIQLKRPNGAPATGPTESA
jgi:GAF domain-containing protein/HAMP domain-containing protein